MGKDLERRRALQAFIDARGVSLNAWAKAAGIRESGPRAFLKGETKSLNLDTYDKLADAANVPVSVLLGEVQDEAHMGTLPDLPPSHFLPMSDHVAVGRYDASLSAGPGSLVDPHADPIGRVYFEAQWLSAITRAAGDNLAVVRVDGDSMEPTLADGDWILIDRTQRKINREGVYAIRVGDVAWVKRISLNLKEKLVQVISDNDRYPMQELGEDELAVIGRAVWIVGRKV